MMPGMWYLASSVFTVSVCCSIILASKFCAPDQLSAGQGSSFLRASEIESCRDSCQAGGILFHVVEFCDLRGGVAEEVGHLLGREGADDSIWLFDSVGQIGGEGVAEGIEPPLFQSGRLQNAVVSFPEVYWPGITSVFIRDERAVLSEVPLRSQIQNSIHHCLIEGHIPLAGGRFQFADLYLSAAGGFAPLPRSAGPAPLQSGVRCSASAYRRPPAGRCVFRCPRSGEPRP